MLRLQNTHTPLCQHYRSRLCQQYVWPQPQDAIARFRSAGACCRTEEHAAADPPQQAGQEGRVSPLVAYNSNQCTCYYVIRSSSCLSSLSCAATPVLPPLVAAGPPQWMQCSWRRPQWPASKQQ
jgi:hypothetical protein